MRKKIILSILLILSLVMIFIGGILGYSMMFKGVNMRYSSLKSYDGTQIAILIAEPDEDNQRFGDQKYGVVVAHGIIGKAESNLPLILALARAGFTVVALDERGHGNSGGSINRLQVGEKEYQDVVRCGEFLEKEMDCKEICLVGHSLGGMAVTRASIWAEEENIVDISGTIAISAAVGSSEDDEPPEALALLYQFFSKTFYIEMNFANIADEMDEGAAPYNYLVIISEADILIPVEDAEELCDLAGGPGKTSKADFNIGNASDLFIIEEDDNAPDHGSTPRDPRSVEKIIDWLEKSMEIDDQYKFNKEEYQSYWDIQHQMFGFAVFGIFILLIPLYAAVKNKILILNKRKSNKKGVIGNTESSKGLKINEREFNNTDLLKLIGIGSAAMFIAPLITLLFSIPVLQTYVVINVFVRDLIIAALIIFIMIIVLKLESIHSIFNSENVKRFMISAIAASIMLLVSLLGMNLFDTYYDINNKWQPFTFNPFILQRVVMFLTLLIEVLFIMGIIEYICRKKVQDNLFNAKNKFTISTLFKTVLVNGMIKGLFITMLIVGLFFAYDMTNVGIVLLITPILLAVFVIGFTILEVFFTIVYQHSKDFWFVNIAIYTYAVWFIASWLIRV